MLLRCSILLSFYGLFFQPEVIEISVELTSSMRSIQTALLEILSACLKELKASNPGVSIFVGRS